MIVSFTDQQIKTDLRHRIPASQNGLDWKGHFKIVESESPTLGRDIFQ